MNFSDALYRSYLIFKGKHYWHWRYYGFGYRAKELEDCYQVSVNGVELTAAKLPLLAEKIDQLSIICSGPSVGAFTEADSLWAEDSLVMNGSHSIYQGDRQVFSYYLISDVGFVRRQWDFLVEGINKSKHLLVDHRVLKEIMIRDASVLNNIKVVLFDLTERPYKRPIQHYQHKPQEKIFVEGRAAFSANPIEGFFPSKTVAFLALEIAIVLGYKNVVYYGLDMGGARFYNETTPEKTMIDKDYDEFILPAFHLASQVCTELDVQVVNASQVSRLPESVFPKSKI